MNDDLEYWHVERYVDLGNETLWHEAARIYRNHFHTDGLLKTKCRRIAQRDVIPCGARWRIRVTKEETVFDSEGASE